MTDADDNICPECPHDLDDHTFLDESGLLCCDLCDCQIDPSEHDIEITDDYDDEEDDDFLDDEESEDDDDYDQDDDDDEENRGEPATPARFPEPVPA